MDNPLQKNMDILHSEMLEIILQFKAENKEEEYEECMSYLFTIVQNYNKFCRKVGYEVKHTILRI